MTPLTFAIAALAVVAAFAVAVRVLRRHLPRPDAPSHRYADLAEGLRLAREESATRTRALNHELELLRRKGAGHGR